MSAAIYGLLAWGILAGAAATFFPRGQRLSVGVAVASLALTPLFAGESLAMALQGALAPPSFSLFLLGLWRIAAPRQACLPRGRAGLLAAGAMLVFFGLALGLGPYDPYGLGYQPAILVFALLPLAAWLAKTNRTAALLVLGLDLFAYGAGLFANFWDALFDPVLALLLLAAALSRRGPG